MRSTFIIKPLVTAVAALSVASVASAAGLDRSGQDISAFLQDGTYAETVYTYIDADVTGHDLNADGSKGKKIKDIAEDYDFFRYGVKTDIDDTFSIGVLYDEPWGAAADYHGDNNFVSNEDSQLVAGGLVGDGEATNVEVRSESLTALLGMKLGQNKEFQVYGGPVAQRLKADVHLRGKAYSVAEGYDLNVNADTDYGWVAGFAYSKPEIALKAALTYRSEIDHSVDATEAMPVLNTPNFSGFGIPASGTNKMEITTPESVNFDFQTGVNPTTLATAKVRWVPWSDFAIKPPIYNTASKLLAPPNGLNLVDYADDQWQVELGLAKRVADNLAVSGTVGWDSGAGDPVTSLGPIEGYYSVGLGAKYDFNKNWAVSAGGKYLMFGDAKGKIPNGDIVSDFDDNDGFALGVKLSYQDK